MHQTKTLQVRTKEMQTLLASEERLAKLLDLASRYGAASDRHRLVRRSVVTYILVHEREQGLIG